MAVVRRIALEVQTNGSGAATVQTPQVNGVIRSVVYVPDGTVPLTNSGSVTITGQASGIPVLAVSAIGSALATFHPRAATVNSSDAAALYAAGGTTVNDLIPVADESIQVVVAAGGANKKGTFHFYVDGAVQGE